MNPDQDPRVPAPRDGGRDTAEDGGHPFVPFVPAPRAAPALERLPRTAPGRVPSAALVPGPVRHVPVVRDCELTGLLRRWARVTARAVHRAVDGLRSLVGALVPAPAPR